MNITFRGIIFDFNGVLWWDDDLQEESWRQFIQAVGHKPLTVEELDVHIHGRTCWECMEYVAGRTLAEPEALQLIEAKEIVYRQMCLDEGDNFCLSPGAIDLLDYLNARAIPHTIATSSEKNNVDFFTRHLHLERWFRRDQIVYDDFSRPGKPAPDIYLQAAKNLGLPPAACIVVEDSHSGIKAAHAAGIGHIVAIGPADTHADLSRLPGVSQVIENLGQLPKETLFG